MKRLVFAVLVSVAGGLTPMSPALAGHAAPIVFFDIAGPADAKLDGFYGKVFGWSTGPGGLIAAPVSGRLLHGALRTDPAGKLIYVGVPDVTAKLNEVVANGGKIVAPRFEVKGVAVIGLFSDPAGNGMGLVELTADERVKVP